METCGKCRALIKDPDKAIYDGELEEWFCSHVCLGLYRMEISGDVSGAV